MIVDDKLNDDFIAIMGENRDNRFLNTIHGFIHFGRGYSCSANLLSSILSVPA